MAMSFTGQKRIRKSFGRIPEVAPMPNLIEVQKSSYDHFLQMGVTPEKRVSVGLQEVFKSVFPIRDFSERAQLEFVRYELETPKYDVEECQQRGITFAAPLKVTLRLVVWDVDEDTGARSIRDIKEQDVYMGDMPLMTHNGTFIINGTERVIVSQMHRTPGVFFDHDKGKTHSSGKYLFAARVIPYRGSWLDFEFDAKDHVYVRIDRRRKLPVTTLLLALDDAATEAKRAERAGRGQDAAAGRGAAACRRRRSSPPSTARSPSAAASTAGRRRSIPSSFKGKLDQRPDRRQDRQGQARRPASSMTPRIAAQARATAGSKRCWSPEDDLVGHYFAEDLINERDRRGLLRGRRRDHRGGAGAARRRPASTNCRCSTSTSSIAVRQQGPLYPQHAGDRQERHPRGRAHRHLPRHAPGRAADAGDRRERCSTACSSTASATICRRSAGSR